MRTVGCRHQLSQTPAIQRNQRQKEAVVVEGVRCQPCCNAVCQEDKVGLAPGAARFRIRMAMQFFPRTSESSVGSPLIL